MTERLYDLPGAQPLLGNIGRTTLYAEITAGRLRSVKVGRRRLIPASAIAEYIAQLEQQASLLEAG